MTPDGAGVLQLASNIGYSLKDSVADLVDNSIDAGAANILVRFYHDGKRLDHIAVIDDGEGMTPRMLEEAMRIGRTSKTADELGKYGIGLKAASPSQASTVSVASRRRGEVAAVRYTQAGIHDGWKLDLLDTDTAAAALDETWAGALSTDAQARLSSGKTCVHSRPRPTSRCRSSVSRRAGCRPTWA